MTNKERILELLASSPRSLTDTEVRQVTGIQPHQQVNQICRRLAAQGLIDRRMGPDGHLVNRAIQERGKPERDGSTPVVLSATRPATPRPKVRSASDVVGSAWRTVSREQRLFLVSCVKTKLSRPAPAKDLYVSDWFRKARTIVERGGSDWRILSAEYGLVHPNEQIRPYEKTLKTMRKAERRAWADRVLGALEPCLDGVDSVVFFAGETYREFLQPALRNHGVSIEVPMQGLAQGHQLAWLGARANA
ncbi:MAG: helix-turn-helix domain-containing protein [Gammaproteobacteria bacterium]|nr:helix-turn-helix domain-containing protein [Gammaproteobacteria bacterium]